MTAALERIDNFHRDDSHFENLLEELSHDPNWDRETSSLFNPDRNRKFSFTQQKFYNPWKNRAIGFYGQTYKGTWAELLTICEGWLPNESSVFSIAVGVLTGYEANSRSMCYSNKFPFWKELWGGGFYGEVSVIEKQLREMKANAIYKNDLPLRIDLPRTIQSFYEHLKNRDFSTPQLVLLSDLIPASKPRNKLLDWAKPFAHRINPRKRVLK